MEVVSFDGRRAIRCAIVPEVEYKNECKEIPPDSSCPENRTPGMRDSGHLGTPSPYIYKNKDKNKYIAQTAAQSSQSAHSASPIRSSKIPEITYCFVKEKFENIAQKDYDTWKTLYPAVDVDREITEMIEWIKENPSKAKSKKLWRKFIRGWLQRQNEKLTNKQAYQAKNKQQNSVLDRHTGFQKDTRPPNPSRIKDYSQWKPDGKTPANDST